METMETDDRERLTRQREAIDTLIRVMRQHHRIVEKRIDGLGVHHSQHRTLMLLSRLGEGVSQRQIAEAMDVSPACVARTLKALESAGLVDKAGGADGRCHEITLRPPGRQVVEDSKAVFRRIGTEMFEGISAGDMDALIGLLRRLQDNLTRMEQGETPCPED